MLGSQDVYTKDFHWTTNLNLGFNINRVLNESAVENSTYSGRESYPVSAIFAHKTTGLDAGGYSVFAGAVNEKFIAEEFSKLNRAGAGTLSTEKQWNFYTYMGATDPKVSGGFVNHFEYGDW